MGEVRLLAFGQVGSGLSMAGHHAEAKSVREAELSLLQRIGAEERYKLHTQCNLANSYQKLGMIDQTLHMRRDVYSGFVRLYGEESDKTIAAALNYAVALHGLRRFREAKALLRKTIPVARRVIGANHYVTLTMKMNYAQNLYDDDGATLDDLREAVTTLEETERAARRVLGGAHPVTEATERALRHSRAALRARDTAPSGSA